MVKNFFIALDELHLDVELARGLLNFRQEEQVVNKGKNLGLGSFLAMSERLDVGLLEETLGLLLASAAAHAATVATAAIIRALVAIAVVHRAGEGLAAAAVAVLPLLRRMLHVRLIALAVLLVV